MLQSKSNLLPAWAVLRLLACATLPLALPLVAALPAAPARAQAGDSFGIEIFHEELAPYGRWVDHPRHGYVWYPSEIDDGWRPYTRGHWVNTEEHGWLWVSDEVWGWATYHYGRWALDREERWYWVPGGDWGPAWVDWRYGDGHIGWAPLAPEVRWRGDGFDYGGVDYGSRLYQPYWIFVPHEYFLSPAIHRHCAPPGRNAVFVQRTRPSTSYVRAGGGIVNRSLSLNYVSEATRRPVPVVRVQAVGRPADLAHGGGRGGPAASTISIFKPAVAINPKIIPRPSIPGNARPADARGPGPGTRGGDVGEQRGRPAVNSGPQPQAQPTPQPTPQPRFNDGPPRGGVQTLPAPNGPRGVPQDGSRQVQPGVQHGGGHQGQGAPPPQRTQGQPQPVQQQGRKSVDPNQPQTQGGASGGQPGR